MCSSLVIVKDEYNCMTDLIPADPKKLVKQLTKIETGLKLVTSKMNSEDNQNGKGQPNTHKESCSSKQRAIAEVGHELKEAIPRKAPSKAKNQGKLCKEHRGVLTA